MVLLLEELLFGLGRISPRWGSFTPTAQSLTLMCLPCLSGIPLLGQMKYLRSLRYKRKIGTREQISSAYFDF